ncbi:integrase core domain-containing protein [Hyphomicrobium sp.]|uniref:integrase core domain-containing protein n=1 Tax=Hyphomicrobium sp. TaxID=82 RepID=UPI003FA53442
MSRSSAVLSPRNVLASGTRGVGGWLDYSSKSKDSGIDRHYIQPSKSQQNAFVGVLMGRLRDELLNEMLFSTLDEARGCWRIFATITAVSSPIPLSPTEHQKSSATPSNPCRDERSCPEF